jgi:hypothetical protein
MVKLKSEIYKGIDIYFLKSDLKKVVIAKIFINKDKDKYFEVRGFSKQEALDNMKDYINKNNLGSNDFGHRIDEMNIVIEKIANDKGLKTEFFPSFVKIKSIIMGDRDRITLSQKQVVANNMKGVFGGGTYEFRNSFSIVHSSSAQLSQIKLNELEHYLFNYVNGHLRDLEVMKQHEERMKARGKR